MGDQNVSTESSGSQIRQFTKAVLNDLQAVGKMLELGLFEDDAFRIGAEQEMFLVDSTMSPAPLSLEILEEAGDERLTTEFGLFNIEANLSPSEFSGKCLSRLENEICELVGLVRKSAEKQKGDVVLVGILPTIQLSDLVIENLTPMPRYKELNKILMQLQGEDRVIHIKGLDDLSLQLNDTFMEFCNTSFQVHLQVPISQFMKYYNWAQAIAGPVLASAANSPILLGHRLWFETRIALFKHATDSRSKTLRQRGQPTRVHFGSDWIRTSMMDAFHEDVARFRTLLTRDIEEDSLKQVEEGKIPKLAAWQMHNGTIWRWNRACYGVLNGKPGFRIEARFLPSGPTVIDEMANTAFFLGLMAELPEEYGDVIDKMSFDDAKDNFYSAARFGLKSQFVWLDGRGYRAKRLILDELLPIARQGLESFDIDRSDIDRYLGVITERAEIQRTSSGWMLESLSKMPGNEKLSVRLRKLTYQLKENQKAGEPMHTWPLAQLESSGDWVDNYRTLEHFMSKDLFTVRPEDVIDLAASLMNWKHIRHVPVEDDEGNLVGVVSHRDLIEVLVKSGFKSKDEIVIKEIMKTDLVTVGPGTHTLDALELMRKKNIGCLPIVEKGKLLGMVTAHDFLTVSARLLEERLRDSEERLKGKQASS
ncbi:MAG: CBS domain-containing protein [Acidobacteria bacterium]|nr:MAG: CBS domain-containing protein [Acidobacteriota bacterium]REK02786.1 MAG: CBS domain-containing protein [Acidobacteriota bacterium]REK13409.1 MAG: CBS domain-containing protein [Acidobacteriota bacterium]REK41403.1 MAG: CBS domain-containing protein [Acidobacteriota bacterium]